MKLNKKLAIIIITLVVFHIIAFGLTIFLVINFVQTQNLNSKQAKIESEHEVIKNRIEDHKKTVSDIFTNLEAQTSAETALGNYNIQQSQIDNEASNISDLIYENQQRIIDYINKTEGNSEDFANQTAYYQEIVDYLEYTSAYGEFNRNIIKISTDIYEKIEFVSDENNRGDDENYGDLFIEISEDFESTATKISDLDTRIQISPIRDAYADYYTQISLIYADLGLLYNEIGDTSQTNINFYTQKFTEIETKTTELENIDSQFEQIYLDSHTDFINKLSDFY